MTMNLLDLTQKKYGPPNLYELPLKYGPPPYSLPSPFMTLFSLITTPIFVISSFIVGSILYLITHKKIFIIIPLILSFLYLIRYFLFDTNIY